MTVTSLNTKGPHPHWWSETRTPTLGLPLFKLDHDPKLESLKGQHPIHENSLPTEVEKNRDYMGEGVFLVNPL
jgi:hypothetical protein